MEISEASVIRSILSEAGRQADHYYKTQHRGLFEFWNELESLASQARSTGNGLHISIVGKQVNPIPIKLCE